MYRKTQILSLMLLLSCIGIIRGGETYLQQDFNAKEELINGWLGKARHESGAWGIFEASESSPKLETDEVHVGKKSEAHPHAVRIIRDDAALATPSTWLIGKRDDPLQAKKASISFWICRESPSSSMVFSLGCSDKSFSTTVAVALSNKSENSEKILYMNPEGKWEKSEVVFPAGEWQKFTIELDFGAMTYSLASGENKENIVVSDYKWSNKSFKGETYPINSVAFIPSRPDKNVCYIDDVEIEMDN